MARQMQKRIGNPHVRMGFWGDMKIDVRHVLSDPNFIDVVKRTHALRLARSRKPAETAPAESALPPALPPRLPK
jgi:hypothetical protein